jgi:hypothetical protein
MEEEENSKLEIRNSKEVDGGSGGFVWGHCEIKMEGIRAPGSLNFEFSTNLELKKTKSARLVECVSAGGGPGGELARGTGGAVDAQEIGAPDGAGSRRPGKECGEGNEEGGGPAGGDGRGLGFEALAFPRKFFAPASAYAAEHKVEEGVEGINLDFEVALEIAKWIEEDFDDFLLEERAVTLSDGGPGAGVFALEEDAKVRGGAG